jgi:hypothetical protein
MHASGKLTGLTALCCLFSFLCTCTSSILVDVWNDPSFNTPPLGKMLVVAVRKDATKRRIWEDAFTAALGKYAIAAMSSYQLFPDSPPDTNELIATVQKNSFDGILAILILPTETNRQHVRGYTTIERNDRYTPAASDNRTRRYNETKEDERYPPYLGPYWKRYRSYYREIEHPGYTDSQTVDVRAIDVSTTGAGGRLIWSATSRTPYPATATDVQRGIASLVLTDLEKRRIINPGK